jgi:5'-3' exonuclease
MKKLIIDGNNLIHRTFWTAKTQSQRTNTCTPDQISNFHIYFTLNAVFSYVTKFNPDKTIFVWDEKPEYQVNERKAEYENYKSNRSGDTAPHQNNNVIKEMLRYLGIPSIFPRQLEADDIVAYICKRTAGQKIIVSVDKDFIQLVDTDTTLYDPIRKLEYTDKNFKERTGCKDTTEWLQIKCITGDRSDNVTGIPKFGKAKIAKWCSGEIVMSEEERHIYDRNLSLFRLDAFERNLDEVKYYEDQLSVEVLNDWTSFQEECKRRDFNSILKKKESWYSLFFLKGKLQSLFA